jgi:quercetin dioxygenase-like cupin family protein
MLSRAKFLCFTFTLSLMVVSAPSHGQEMVRESSGQNVSEMKFVTIPGLPTCTTGSVQSGNPTKGPSFILAKAPAGCSVPWHWHTANEHLMLVSGSARLEMKDGKSLTLLAGGFALMPTREVHQFSCLTECILYVYSDVAFDIHYVDKSGNEISPADALKMVKETAATEMK